MSANRGLLAELDETKRRYADDARQWETNFEQLRSHYSQKDRDDMKQRLQQAEADLFGEANPSLLGEADEEPAAGHHHEAAH